VEQGSTPVELLATNIRTREQAEQPQTNSEQVSLNQQLTMAGRSLRRRTLDDLTNSELLELPCGQQNEILDSTPEDVSQPHQAETGVSDEVHLVDEMTDRDDDDTAISKGSDVANIQAPPADLLNIIWQSLQKDREERTAERKQEEEIRRSDEEARLAAEKRNEERLAKLREDIINSAEIVSRQFRGELDKQS
jgi:hypothetical protein